MLSKTSGYLQRLRSLMVNGKFINGSIEAYIIPSCDEHQSEYIAPCDKRRALVTGFTGSTGTAVVTFDKAALWTDGRYHLQAAQEIDENWILMKEGLAGTPTYTNWLCNTLPVGSRVGIDPLLIADDHWKNVSRQLERSGHSLISVPNNLVDAIWDDRPTRSTELLRILDVKYSGIFWQHKVLEVRTKMKEHNASCLVITDLAEIAWLLNLRGSDIEYNPVFFAYVIVTNDTVHLFIDSSKLDKETVQYLQIESGVVTVHPYESVKEFLLKLVHEIEGKVWINEKSSHALIENIPQDRHVRDMSPIQMMKAVKNHTELEGMKLCHVRDGVALCQYFCWLESNVPKGDVTEVSGADVLEQFRSEQEDYVGLSFATISSSGPNGAIMHYCPSKKTDRPITTSEMYLCDSGGQYKNGTTDITRTWHFGTPTAFEKECYTRVLKCHIALSTTVFPKNTKGNKLDVIARLALWDVGLDYLHGTGHGVGSYLNVHEGPMGIHYRAMPDDPGIQQDMIMTIEPGYYEDGKFGIRLENVVWIKEAETQYKFKNVPSLTFEPVSFHPIQTKLIVTDLLTEKEINWLNDYHENCRKVLGPVLKEQGKNATYEWLLQETQPI